MKNHKLINEANKEIKNMETNSDTTSVESDNSRKAIIGNVRGLVAKSVGNKQAHYWLEKWQVRDII